MRNLTSIKNLKHALMNRISLVIAATVASTATMAAASYVESSSRDAVMASKRVVESSRRLDLRIASDPSSARRFLKETSISGLAPLTDAPLTEAPDGESTLLTRNSYGYIFYWGNLFYTLDEGSALERIDCTDGSVYFSNPISQLDLDCYLRGEVDAATGDVVIKAGQAIMTKEFDGELKTAYAVPLEYVITNEEEQAGWYYPVESGEMRFVNDNGVLKAEDPEILLGLCSYEDGEFWFQGYGDSDIVISPQTDTVLQLPDGLEPEKWAYVYDQTGYFVNVAVDGDRLYLSGLFSIDRDNYVVGTIKGDKVTFDADQYLGIDTYRHFAYLNGATLEPVWDDMFQEYVDKLRFTGDVVMSYDAQARTVKADSGIALATVRGISQTEYFPIIDYIADFSARYEQRNPNTLPSAPFNVEIRPYDENYGYGNISFSMSALDSDGCLLDTDNLYYEIYADGKPFTLKASDYLNLSEDITLIPFTFRDGYDISYSGIFHGVFFYQDGIDELAVQSVYFQEVEGSDEPLELRSDIVGTTGIDDIQDYDSEAVSVEYYDLTGRRVANPAHGIYLRIIRFADGFCSSSKVVR